MLFAGRTWQLHEALDGHLGLGNDTDSGVDLVQVVYDLFRWEKTVWCMSLSNRQERAGQKWRSSRLRIGIPSTLYCKYFLSFIQAIDLLVVQEKLKIHEVSRIECNCLHLSREALLIVSSFSKRSLNNLLSSRPEGRYDNWARPRSAQWLKQLHSWTAGSFLRLGQMMAPCGMTTMSSAFLIALTFNGFLVAKIWPASLAVEWSRGDVES